MPLKPNTSPRNVRLDPVSIQRLKTIAANHGISTSTLVRNAVLEKLPQWERHGVTLSAVGRHARAAA